MQLKQLKTLISAPDQLVQKLDQYSIQQLNQYLTLLPKEHLITTLIQQRKAHYQAHQASQKTAALYAYQSLTSQLNQAHNKQIKTFQSKMIQKLQAYVPTNHSKQNPHIAILLPLSGRYKKQGKVVKKELQKLHSFFPKFKITYLFCFLSK